MCGAIPSLPQYAFMALCSVKEKNTGATLFFSLSYLMLWHTVNTN